MWDQNMPVTLIFTSAHRRFVQMFDCRANYDPVRRHTEAGIHNQTEQ